MKQYFSTLVLAYLRFWAQLQLRKNHPTIIGITGTAGKTSTMHAVDAVLKDSFPIKVSYKANSESGIPLNILGLHAKTYTTKEWLAFLFLAPWQFITNWEEYQAYVVEMGIDSPFPPKNMEFLLSIIKPDIGIFLNARPMHSESFDVLARETDPHKRREEITRHIAKEKGKMIKVLPKSGLAILNADDNNVSQFRDETDATVYTFGSEESNELHIVATESTLQGTIFTFQSHLDSSSVTFKNYVLPPHYAYSLAPAILVGQHMGLSLEQCTEALEKNFVPPAGRATLIKGINHSLILDSSYNASAQAMIDSLELLQLSKGRKLALLGDMRELGKETQTEHELVATHIVNICDHVFLVGPQMQQYVLPILENKNIPVEWFATAGQAATRLQKVMQKNDMLLVKGSQNTLFLEIAVEKLMAQPEDAENLLCRRGAFWDKQRKPYLS